MIPVSNVEITYLCDGVAKEFPFPYEYYDKTNIVGFVIGADGITTKITTNFTFNEVSKKFIYPVEGTALLSGNKIKIRRVTELSQTLDLPNEYPFGNIEKTQDKLTMIMQELNYIGVTSVPEIEQSLIDKLNTVIINTNTVKEYEAYALQHRNDAETFKNNASSSASNALTSASNAKTSEDNAKLSEDNAKLSETNAKTSETNAKLSEDNAKASELNAKNSENNAKTSELNAQTYATKLESADINLRKNSKTYVVGDVAYSLNLPTWARLDCIQGGTTASTEPTWGTVTAGQVFTDGTVQWRIADVKSSGDSVGSIKAWLVKNIPAGWLDVTTGAMVSRATYPELWAWVQANAPLISEADWQTQANAQSSVGAFSTGDGSTTFRLPKIVDYVRGGILADVGKWQGDVIRNITGGPINAVICAPTGALVNNGTISYGGGGGAATATNVSFDASKVVPTADENRPKTIKMVYCVKAFGSPTNQGLIDITALANEMAGKQQAISYIQIQDEKPAGTAGGTLTTGAWRTRTLNTIKSNDNNIATLSNNQITIPAGTYIIDASAPSVGTDLHQIRLQNVSDNTTIATGSSENSSSASAGDGVQTRSFLGGKFTLSSTKTIELQHYAGATSATVGFGQSISFNTEVYAIIKLWKVG